MIKIGLCGTIGRGKSTVCRLFEQLGVAVYIADDMAKTALSAIEDAKINAKYIIHLYFLQKNSTFAGVLDHKIIV